MVGLGCLTKVQSGMKMLQINKIDLVLEKNCFIWFTTIHLQIHFFSLMKKKFKAVVLTEILGVSFYCI